MVIVAMIALRIQGQSVFLVAKRAEISDILANNVQQEVIEELDR
ncbi:hypothetical protein [Oligella urethralis]|nr:hypothetical protein [Oligella urethralis]